ncbi:endolytic transglycosylase MltG [Thalassobacillus sp. C254]|uniref:endolytic transglycosylase MltG n=1 Tax=Thalassobacillus sp. C254 TaxID=1225341 RepID=UPI0006D1E787|nr:endolytic transglycosylase MltG [Thalassobacillus sp. C254]
MTKPGMRNFAAGWFTVSAFLAVLYFYTDIIPSSQGDQAEGSAYQPSTLEMVESLESNGYLVWEKTEYEENLIAQNESSSDSLEEEQIYITILQIEKGMNSKEVAQTLEALHIIQDADSFQAKMADKEVTHSIKTGSYELNSSMSADEIIEVIT